MYCTAGHLSHLEIDTEDMAEVLLQFANHIVASVHLDYVRREYECSLEIVGEEGIIQWQYQEQRVRWYKAADGIWRQMRWLNYDGNEMYLAEMRHFLKALAGKEASAQNILSAKRVLEIALAAKQSAKQGRSIRL